VGKQPAPVSPLKNPAALCELLHAPTKELPVNPLAWLVKLNKTPPAVTVKAENGFTASDES